ncbi:DUF354 domain-containing protein [Halobellus inordinatus]|uniref:DUF354 domain-containing protein n=1 Tax=Halobellus inordinatus TaxID=1126236 RepID=UPI00210C75E9|nr:DUF354 domain-containing protein [Halobellus inordinatus]
MNTISRPESLDRTRATVPVWVDLVSPSHPFFFAALMDRLDGVALDVTVREKGETVPLAREVGFDFRVVGRDFDHETLRKVGIPLRTGQLGLEAPDAAVALSARNAMSVLAARANGIPSIHYTDNDITAYVDGLWAEQLYNRLEALATHNVVPAAFERDELERWPASGAVHTYDGIKEDVYVADFEPEPDFTDRFPFETFVVIRPEALTAAYVDVEASLVPKLLEGFVDRDIPVVYLPRGRGDEEFADPYDRSEVFVPENPLNGLDLAWNARCMLTGSGTMAREAASLGTPAVSFFPNELLSVDRHLVEEGRIFHSRHPDDIVAYVTGLDAADAVPDTSRAERVQEEVARLTARLINSEVDA